MPGIEDLADAIQQEVNDYYDELQESIDKAVDIVAKEAESELKENSPERTGEYARGWRRKKYKYRQVVYNAKKPNLTAPLEYGHARRDGDRVDARPHIKPIEEIAKEQIEDLTITIISEGLRL